MEHLKHCVLIHNLFYF